MINYYKKDYQNVLINEFSDFLWSKGSSKNSIDTYYVAVYMFIKFLNIKNKYDLKLINKLTLRNFIEYLKNYEYQIGKKYSVSTINIKIAGINQFLKFNNLNKFKIKLFRLQRKPFFDDNEMLTNVEFNKLIDESKKVDKELYYVERLMAQTGIRVTETILVTVESLYNEYIEICNKGCVRRVPIPIDLREELLNHCKIKNITKGYIFLSKNGKLLSRSNIYKKMKKIAKKINIDEKKVKPHNLRHLFALTFLKTYGYESISVLSDILGHKSIETTRVYLREKLSLICEKITYEKLYGEKK